MKVNYSGDLYIVSWEHWRNLDQFTREDVVATKGGKTICRIYKGKQDDVCRSAVGNGMAVCHYKDTYCKSIGRKLSLALALQSCTNREFRKAVWDTYKKECR